MIDLNSFSARQGRNHVLTVAALGFAAVIGANSALAQDKLPAVLEGHAIVPAKTFITPPADVPELLKTSGKFTATDMRRVDKLDSIVTYSALSDPKAPRPIGINLPFKGQPFQGLSGIKKISADTYITLTDNGFGAKANSADHMLMLHTVKPDWKTGKVQRLNTIFLHDPDKKVPFLIVTEGTQKRYLTGADFDIESVQPIGQNYWFGDELGPYLIKTDHQGKVLAVFDTMVDGKRVRSPDNYSVAMPGAPGAVKFEVRRSKGFEGMAQSPDGKFLYGLLEGALFTDNGTEMKDGKEYLRILEFDVAKGAWTGKSFKYTLEANGNAIGDFNMIDAETALIIERDNGEGDIAQACEGEPKPTCFNVPAKFKRIYKIDFKAADADGFVKKVAYIDLMDIQDPKHLARQGGQKNANGDGKLTFPFFTIENVDIVDATHIIVANDNNLPYSSGRALGRSDDNEFILLSVPELLKAR